jgi:hypothetical protein
MIRRVKTITKIKKLKRQNTRPKCVCALLFRPAWPIHDNGRHGIVSSAICLQPASRQTSARRRVWDATPTLWDLYFGDFDSRLRLFLGKTGMRAMLATAAKGIFLKI